MKPTLTEEQAGTLIAFAADGGPIYDIGGPLAPVIEHLHQAGMLHRPDPALPRYLVSPKGFDVAADLEAAQ